MQSIEQLKNRTRHDVMLVGDNSSYLTTGYFPRAELVDILPAAMSIPSDAVMADAYPATEQVEGMHPILLMFSNCRDVHDVLTEIKLRPYRELMFFIPVVYRHENEEQLCSYVPVLYLDFLLGVVGGLSLGLRKQFHPRMRDVETGESKAFVIDGILDARFRKSPSDLGQELDPFFTRTLENPTVTVSYLNRTRFYTTRVYPTTVLGASADYEWRYKGSVIKSNADTVANYAAYRFTTSQAMSHSAYFHPSYSVERE